MSSYDEGTDSRAAQLIQDRQERLEAILDQFSWQAADVSLSPETKREIAVHIVNYHRVLSRYEDESVLADGDIPDISPIRDRLGRTTRVVSEGAMMGFGGGYDYVPAVDELDFFYLESVAGQLEAAAKKLGFWASANSQRTLYDAGKKAPSQYPNPVDDQIPKPTFGADGGDGAVTLRESKLYHDWYQRVACGDPNDYVIAISADPRSTGVSGSGKTTLGGGLAKDWFDYSEDGFDAEVQYTLDAAKLAYDLYEETGELSVLVGDEMQGTPATTGLNAKRSQKSEALDAVNAIAAGRSDRKTVILIVQDLKSLNKDALTFIDAWLLIRDDFDYIATHYGVAPDVFDLGSRETKTPGIEQITWSPLDDDDPDYQEMERKKEQAKQGQREYSEDQDDSAPSMPMEERNRMIRVMSSGGMENDEIAEEFDLTPGRISQIVNSEQ
jgi:hypothetical protein